MARGRGGGRRRVPENLRAGAEGPSGAALPGAPLRPPAGLCAGVAAGRGLPFRRVAGCGEEAPNPRAGLGPLRVSVCVGPGGGG